MAIQEISADNFDKMIDTDYAVVDCYGTFCSACVILEPIYEGLAGDMAAVRFLKVNMDENMSLMERFDIDAIPTLLYFRNGKLIFRTVGSMDREQLKEHMAKMLYGKD